MSFFHRHNSSVPYEKEPNRNERSVGLVRKADLRQFSGALCRYRFTSLPFSTPSTERQPFKRYNIPSRDRSRSSRVVPTTGRRIKSRAPHTIFATEATCTRDKRIDDDNDSYEFGSEQHKGRPYWHYAIRR